MENPNEALAKIIQDRLQAEGLLSDEQRKRIGDKLATGKLKQEDWLSAIEQSASKEKRHAS
jgi:hypothetical protein